MDLFIPAKINKDNILGNGFGKRELSRLVVTAIIGFVIGLLTTLLVQGSTQTSIFVVMGITAFFAAVGYFLFLKNSINQSIYDMVLQCIHFYREQRMYPYHRLKEWS